MNIRFATNNEISNWNNYIIANPDGGNVFASFEFAMQKETGGYKARFIFADDIAITVLEKNVLSLGKLWYFPKGPEVKTTKKLLEILENIKQFAIKNNVFVIRIETELNRDQQSKLNKFGLIKSIPVIPNPSTITLDISNDLAELLISLPQKGRYAINRAIRDGVTVNLVNSNDQNCKIMYDLLSITAEDKFGIRSYDYYRSFWQRFEAAGFGQLFFAYYNKKVVAGAYAMTYGKKSTYKDGASIKNRPVYGASHLLQWRVIEWAKSKGSIIHDFCGSPPSDQIDNVNHKHYGIGLFKTAFSKDVIDYIGCNDYVINSRKYKVWAKIGERISRRLHYRKHHDSYF